MATALRELPRYRVKRWTAYQWVLHADREVNREREDHLKRAVAMMQRKLSEVCPRFQPTIEVVRIDNLPQMLFTFTVPAVGENEAKDKALRNIGRALQTKIPTGRRIRTDPRSWRTRAETVTLNPPWGSWQITEAP